MKINLLRVIQVTVLMAFYFDTLSLKAEDIFQKKMFSSNFAIITPNIGNTLCASYE